MEMPDVWPTLEQVGSSPALGPPLRAERPATLSKLEFYKANELTAARQKSLVLATFIIKDKIWLNKTVI